VGLTGVFSEEPGSLHGRNIFALPELSSAVPEWTTAGRIATERVVRTLPHNRSAVVVTTTAVYESNLTREKRISGLGCRHTLIQLAR
jgi:hypothetical protein